MYVGLGILGFFIYIFLLVYCGLKTMRNGHMALFIIGFFFFPVWIVGSMIPPKGMTRVDAMYAQKEHLS